MKLAVVIPCYRVRDHILAVLRIIGPEIDTVYVVDDKCPEDSGALVEKECSDPRVKIIYHEHNCGVGGATISGYRAAIGDGVDIVIKLDGDGQMDPRLIPRLVEPIVGGKADYVKGNRFFSLESLHGMPWLRLFGNSVLSFVSKAATGYWNLMDPTNGFTAIHRRVLEMLPLQKIDQGYFFESDMLFRLNTIRAVVREVPMDAVYAEEQSSLSIARASVDFPFKYFVRFGKRIFYSYFLRDFNVGSLELLVGSLLLAGGFVFGCLKWYYNARQGIITPTGTIMLAALPVIIGFQLLVDAITFDVMNVPKQPIHQVLK